MNIFKLFGIDLQNAFTQEGEPLCVPGAPADNVRIRDFIRTTAPYIADIILTVDTHPVDHIGHPGWWRTREGAHPTPFTFVTEDMLLHGDIMAADPDKNKYALEYVRALGGAMIWPVHCVPGTDSHKLSPEIQTAINNWRSVAGGVPTIVKKGFHVDLESFGIFEPEYQGHENIFADFNDNLLGDLLFGDHPIVVVGEASSHCVKRSVEQMVMRLDLYGVPGHGKEFDFSRIVLLRDCMSPVPSFEGAAEQFFKDMAAHGLRITTSKEFIDTLVGG